MTQDKHRISFKNTRNDKSTGLILHDHESIAYVLSDIQAYVNATMASSNYVEPAPTASKSVTYSQLFEELKSPV